MKIVKWLIQHCFKDKEKWFGKRYINIEYDLYDVVFRLFYSSVYFIGLFIYLFFSGNSFLISLVLSFGGVIVLLGYAYFDILYKHFIKNKHKKD